MNENTSTDPQQLKAAARAGWNKAAGGWNKHTPQIHQWLASATELMLDGAGIKSGMRVLDVASGAGDQALDAARRAGEAGYVLATDISAEILSFATENARQAGLKNIDTKVADAEDLGLPAGDFDAAICRMGLMFCPDPGKALEQIHRTLKPGSRVSVLVFSQPEKNPCVSTLMQTAFKYAGVPPADPCQPGRLFSLGRTGQLDQLLVSAGFQDVTSRILAAPFTLSSAAAYLEFIRDSASPVLQVLSHVGEFERSLAWQEMEEKLNVFQTESGWEGPHELVLAQGRAP